MHSSGNGVSIGLDMISPKQLVGESLEMGNLMLRELVEVFCNNSHIEMPFNQDQVDRAD